MVISNGSTAVDFSTNERMHQEITRQLLEVAPFSADIANFTMSYCPNPLNDIVSEAICSAETPDELIKWRVFSSKGSKGYVTALDLRRMKLTCMQALAHIGKAYGDLEELNLEGRKDLWEESVIEYDGGAPFTATRKVAIDLLADFWNLRVLKITGATTTAGELLLPYQFQKIEKIFNAFNKSWERTITITFEGERTKNSLLASVIEKSAGHWLHSNENLRRDNFARKLINSGNWNERDVENIFHSGRYPFVDLVRSSVFEDFVGQPRFDINQKTVKGRQTLLHLACTLRAVCPVFQAESYVYYKAVALLLNRDELDVNPLNANNETPLDLLRRTKTELDARSLVRSMADCTEKILIARGAKQGDELAVADLSQRMTKSLEMA